MAGSARYLGRRVGDFLMTKAAEKAYERMFEKKYRKGKGKTKRRTRLQYKPSVGELKGVDTTINIAQIISTVNTNGDTFVINGIASGSESYERVGRKVYPQYIYIKGRVTYSYSPVATTQALNAGKMIMRLVWDSQPSGVIPAYDDIFGRTIVGGTDSTGVFDPLFYDNVGRFKVLLEKTICSKVMSSILGGTTNTITDAYDLDEFYRFPHGYQTIHSDTGATIASISTGACYLIFRADTSASTSLFILGSDSMVRFRYKDN